MPNLKAKRPNALKHGAFAKTAILRGEDPQEFQDLVSVLIVEWRPIGPTEEDAVLSIAKCVWRKRRMQRFIEAEAMNSEIDPSHTGYNEVATLRLIASFIKENPEESFARYDQILASRLSVDRYNKLNQKFPQQNFASPSEWGQAVKNEITSVWLPALGERGTKVLSVLSAATLLPELFKLELALDERLDAMIDRAIKRLIQTKAMKQMLDHTSQNGGDDQPKRIQNGKSDGSAKIVDTKIFPIDSVRALREFS
jgi:hypothetical protein